MLEAPRAPAVALGGLTLLAIVVFGLIAKSHSIPSLFPDEFIYGNVAQSIAHGNGANWRGEGQGVPLLYPLLIAPGFAVGSAVGGYLIAKLIGVVAVSLTGIPTWLLGRDLVGARRALIPAVLSVAGTWMLYSQELVSENLALPLATACLCATVITLRRPGSRWIWIAFAFAAASMFTRVMLAVLPAVIAAALILDVVRQPREARAARLRAHRLPLLALAAVVVLGFVYVLASDSTVGRYDVFPSGISVGHALSGALHQGLLAVVMVGVVPFAATLALATRAHAWRDETSGPLLAVLVPATLGISLLAGWFIEGNGFDFPVQRYVVYLGPLMFLALVLVPGRVDLPRGLLAVLASAALLLALPAASQVMEQAALFGTTNRLGQLISSFEATRHPSLGIALAALPIGGAGMWLLTRGGPEGWRAGALPGALLVLVVLVVQVQAVAHSHLDFIHRARAQFPAHLDWIERASSGPVGLVNQGQFVGYNRLAGLLIVRPAYWTEFFNPSVDALYVTPDIQREQTGGTCPWGYGADGGLTAAVQRCHPVPRQLAFVPAPFETRFKGERPLAQSTGGRLITTGRDPRLLSFVQAPCIAGATCQPAIAGTVFLAQPGTVDVRFRGQGGSYTATVKRKQVRIGPSDVRTVQLSLRTGTQSFQVPVSGTGLFPQVTVSLRQGASETRIY